MTVVVVTRLRVSDAAFLDAFFTAAIAVTEQAQSSDGNLGADVLAEANNVYWTRTVWRDRDAMHGFVGTEPHLATMSRIAEWCDEATFADWEQTDADMPDWQNGYRRLIADGQSAQLSNASAAHQTRAFAPPVVDS